MPSGILSKLNTTTIYSAFPRTKFQQRGGWRCSINLLLGPGNLLFGNSALLHSLPYSASLISGASQLSLGCDRKRKSMAASTSKALLGDVYVDELFTSCGNALDFSKPAGVFFHNGSRSRCCKATLSFRRQKGPSSRLLCGNFSFDGLWWNSDPSLFVEPWSKNVHTSSSACYSTGADVSFDSNSRDERVADSTILSGQIILGDRTLKLISGSCYLPHPDKEEKGGEDAHFICIDEQAIGVADGVGGWADVGVDAGLFARELMSYSVTAIQEEPKGSIDPARVLEKAHSSTKAKGSSTACIIALTDEGLHAINLGDSGFVVVRDGCIVFQSPVQQHGFNFTYQLESGSGGDLPSSGQVFTIPATTGDVIVAGTDGLFDNLYNNEVTSVVVHAVRAGLEPQVTAQKIAALARQRALDRSRSTPFSTAAQEAGFRYYGGKLDDITVVVSYVTSSVGV